MSERNDQAKLNFLDRAIAFVNPQAGMRRLEARIRMHAFEANQNRADSGGMSRNANSESWRKQRDRFKQMWDARDLAEFDWIGGTLGRIVLYVCGELSCKSQTGDPELDALYDEYFHNWCGEEEDEDGFHKCDLSGRHRFLKMVQIALLAMFVDGDHGFILSNEDANGVPFEDLKLQSIEADRIGSPLEAIISPTYVGGVTFDVSSGRPTSYRIFDRTHLGQYVKRGDIEPASFVHLWDPKRSDQYRGRSVLVPVLDDLRYIRQWIEAEFVAGNVQSQYAGLIGTRDPQSNTGAGFWDKKDKDGNLYREAKWGQLLKVAEGESFNMLRPADRPSGAFMAFLQTVIRKIAVALDLPFGFVWDLSGLGGVTGRIEVRQAERRIRYWQRLLVDRMLRRVRKLVLDYGVAYHGLPAHPLMRKCEWHFGPWIVTDVGYEAQNDIAMLQTGLMSAAKVAAKYDGDMIENARTNTAIIKALQQISVESGVPIEAYAGGWLANISQQLAAMQSPPPPPPKPGSLDAVGEKGAAQIIDLLSKVTTGQLDPEAAKQTLVTVYRVSAQLAEELVPKPKPPPKQNAGGDDTTRIIDG